jgi:hypothetical protein
MICRALSKTSTIFMRKNPMASKIDPKKIRTDCDTQSRLEMDEEVIAEYAAAMERGEEFPAILVFFDEETDEFILADGWHRFFAHLRARPNDRILAEQRMGTLEDAQWASIGANKSHGLQRSNADKRNAVIKALLHPNGANSSNRQIAKHVGVHNDTVGIIRRELELTAGIRQSDVRTGQDGRTINTAQIGAKPNQNTDSADSCGGCLNFSPTGTCMLDSGKRTPWTEACEDYEKIPPEPPRRELPPPPEDYEILDGPKKVKHNTQEYKPRNTIKVDVPLSNPDLAAVELRSSLGEEYLRSCFIAVRVLLAEQD